MDDIVNWLDRHEVSLVPVLMTAVVLIGAAVVIMLLKRLLRSWLRRLQPRLNLPYETALTVTRVFTGTLWVIALMLALEIWGISLGGLWTLAVSAVTVVGVGFLATWTMISNVTASFFITIWRPFHLGDTVEVLPEGLKGRVIDRNLMFVAVREDDGAVIRIPNNLFFQKMFRVIDGANQTLFEALETKPKATRERQPT